jgi:hypothetical protein
MLINSVNIVPGCAQIFQKIEDPPQNYRCRKNDKTEDPQMLGVIVQNSVARTTRRPGFMHPSYLLTHRLDVQGNGGTIPSRSTGRPRCRSVHTYSRAISTFGWDVQGVKLFTSTQHQRHECAEIWHPTPLHVFKVLEVNQAQGHLNLSLVLKNAPNYTCAPHTPSWQRRGNMALGTFHFQINRFKAKSIHSYSSRCGLHRTENTQRLSNQTSMPYMEIIVVSSENHTKHKNTLCGWKL